MRKKEGLTKASLLNMMYPRLAFPSGAGNYTKNARQAQKPKKNKVL